MFGVSTAYLRTLEKEDPAFCATWRRGDVATWHPRAVRRRSVAPLLHPASSRLRTTRHRQHVAGQARAGRVVVRQRPAGLLPLERRPETARSREGVLTRRVVQRHLGEGAPVPTGRVHHLMGRCERQASRADLGELVSLGLMSSRWAWRDRHDHRRGDVPHRSPRRRIRTLRAFRPQTGRPAARLRRYGFQCSVGTGRPTGWMFLESAEGDPFGGPVAVRLGVGGWWSTVGRTRSV